MYKETDENNQFNMEDHIYRENPTFSDLYYREKQIVVLLPETYRKILKLSLPKKIEDKDVLYKTISESIQLQYNSSKIYILSIIKEFDEIYKIDIDSSNSESNKKKVYYYNIIYIIVPKDLIYKLENEGINSIKYYIVKSDTTGGQTQIKFSNRLPSLDMISTMGENNMYLPFSWRVNIS